MTSAQVKSKFEELFGQVKRDVILTLAAFGLVIAGWGAAFLAVGTDVDQGQVYRIIYVHVPVAWNAFLWVIVSAVFAIWGLLQRSKLPVKDLSSQAAIEVGTMFAALSLLTGMIWGRPTWGVWWDWDPRLVSTLVMFLVCCGYHMLRGFTPDLNSKRLMASGVSLLAAVNVPIVYYSVNIWRSIHQPQTISSRGSTASSDIVFMMLLNSVCMIVLGYALYRLRRGGLSVEHALDQARQTEE